MNAIQHISLLWHTSVTYSIYIPARLPFVWITIIKRLSIEFTRLAIVLVPLNINMLFKCFLYKWYLTSDFL